MLKEKGVHKDNTMASQAYSVRMFTVVLKYIHIFSLAYLASRVSNTETHQTHTANSWAFCSVLEYNCQGCFHFI